LRHDIITYYYSAIIIIERCHYAIIAIFTPLRYYAMPLRHY
jgi:hypothetical protein